MTSIKRPEHDKKIELFEPTAAELEELAAAEALENELASGDRSQWKPIKDRAKLNFIRKVQANIKHKHALNAGTRAEISRLP